MNLQNFINDFFNSLQFLTRLPVSNLVNKNGNPQRAFLKSVWAFPLAGFVISLLLIIFSCLLYSIGFSSSIIAIVLIIVGLFLTGALHEDGLADCADGFGGGHEKEKKLLIMKDSRIGTYGVSALICLFLLRYSLYESLLSHSFTMLALALVTSFMFSRSLLVLFWYLLPFAKEDGLANSIGKPSSKATLIALSIGFLSIFLILPFTFNALQVFMALLFVVLAFSIFRYLCLKHIGGQTGDTIGAVQVAVECSFLLGLTTF